MTKENAALFVSLFTLFFAQLTAWGGWGVVDGSKRDFWAEDGFSLIVAKVKRVEIAPDRARQDGTGTSHILTIEPMATVAGHFDTSGKSPLRACASIGNLTTSVQKIPAVGDTVLTVIAFDADRSEYFILSLGWMFMPERSAMVTITGLDDKRIAEVLAKIREIRASAAKEPGALTTPETQPSQP